MKKANKLNISQADLDIIQSEYCLFDDLYMNMFMAGQNECAKALIAPIIKKDDLIIKEVVTQKDLRSMGGKSIVLDILATDKNGKLYNIEIQRADAGADILRARLNVSLIDSEAIKKGKTFKDLPVIYVIFFTENDIYKKGRATYKAELFFTPEDEEEDKSTCVHKDEMLDIGVHIIYVNGQYKGNDAIGSLLADMWQKNPEKIQNKALAERTKFIKKSAKKGGENMGRLLEKYQMKWLDEGREEGREEERLNLAKALLKDRMNLESVSKYTGLSIVALQELQSEVCA